MGETIKFAPKNETAPQKPQPDLSEVIAEPKRGPNTQKTETPNERIGKKFDAFMKEIKQQKEAEERIVAIREKIGSPEKKTMPLSLADLETKAMASQHRKLATSDFEPMAVAAKMERSEVLPPADIAGTKLSDRAEQEKPVGFWGKLKSLVTTSRDERAYQKFGQMAADTDETSADRRAAAKGEAMMTKAEKRMDRIDRDEDIKAIKSPARDVFIKIDDTPGKFAEKITSDRMYKKAGTAATELKVGLREGQKEYDLNRQADAFETKHTAMGKAEFKKTMQAGELRARAEQLETESESETRRGPKTESGRVGMEKFSKSMEQLDSRLNELQPIVKSTKLGLFAHLKIDSAGYITNLPEGNENIVFEYLAKEKERLDAKGKIDKANEIVEQMEALEEYTQLLVERDKFLVSAQ